MSHSYTLNPLFALKWIAERFLVEANTSSRVCQSPIESVVSIFLIVTHPTILPTINNLRYALAQSS